LVPAAVPGGLAHVALLGQAAGPVVPESLTAHTAPSPLLPYKISSGKSVIYLKVPHRPATLIKKKIKFSSYIRKFRIEQLQSHICMTNGLLLYGEIFAHFLIY
jgi:hypothetical protein